MITVTTQDKLISAPCVFCNYAGPEYWQTHTHHHLCPWHDIGGMAERREALPAVMKTLYTVAYKDGEY